MVKFSFQGKIRNSRIAQILPEIPATLPLVAAYVALPRGEHITYRQDGETYTGEILWVAAAHLGSRRHRVPAHYIVARDGAGDSFPDIVFFGDVVIDS